LNNKVNKHRNFDINNKKNEYDYRDINPTDFEGTLHTVWILNHADSMLGGKRTRIQSVFTGLSYSSGTCL
jgi:hypothetical protein